MNSIQRFGLNGLPGESHPCQCIINKAYANISPAPVIQVSILQPLSEWQRHQGVHCGSWEGAAGRNSTHHQEPDMVCIHRHLGKEGEGMPFLLQTAKQIQSLSGGGLQTFYSGGVLSMLKEGHHQLVWEMPCSRCYSTLQWAVCMAELSFRPLLPAVLDLHRFTTVRV